jgi:hypothetical protein
MPPFCLTTNIKNYRLLPEVIAHQYRSNSQLHLEIYNLDYPCGAHPPQTAYSSFDTPYARGHCILLNIIYHKQVFRTNAIIQKGGGPMEKKILGIVGSYRRNGTIDTLVTDGSPVIRQGAGCRDGEDLLARSAYRVLNELQDVHAKAGCGSGRVRL